MTTEAITRLRQRMIDDINARKLGKHKQRGHIHSCKRVPALSSAPRRRRRPRTFGASSCTWRRQERAPAIATAS
jgi:hypothetical protein